MVPCGNCQNALRPVTKLQSNRLAAQMAPTAAARISNCHGGNSISTMFLKRRAMPSFWLIVCTSLIMAGQGGGGGVDGGSLSAPGMEKATRPGRPGGGETERG